MLEVEQVRLRPWRAWGKIDAVVGWGEKSNTRLAVAFARSHSLPYLRLEDGFLRSVGLGDRDPPLSMVVDDLGIYYDARGPSRLEVWAAAQRTSAELERARGLVGLWRSGRVSKYNHAREAPPPVDGPFVLVVDQTLGDASIRCGLADEASFQRMLEAALDEHPGLPVVLKVHPEVVSGRKRGHFGSLSQRTRARVVVLGTDAHVPALLEAAHAVYTVTSQVGFEALLWGKPVRCFGMPFYAGWGLTDDALPAPERRRPIAFENLVHAALVDYPRYLDPETDARCEPERLLEWIALQRRMRERFAPEVHGLGFSRWKKPIVRAFFQGSDVRFVRRLGDVPRDATLAVWGKRPIPEGRCRSVVRLEDGFLRSVGLGAELVRPLSWVLDAEGMYYDATAPSGLETILATAEFDDALVGRARALRERVTAAGITKYNVGHGRWERPAGASRVVLVPGQVESDASLAYGAAGIRTNVELLRAAREAAPTAHLVYKPHPDVVARLRAEGAGEGRARDHCDEVVVDVPMDDLLRAVDEVHVLTSLAGFEALLRGRDVVTHGSPFYAGWGLTRDMAPLPRRGRSLTLDELVSGVLILYPTYVSRTTGRFTTPERTLDELLAWRGEARASTPPPWRRALRWALGALKR
jgi:capsular polysaccharide export protein